jgi:hypothetical protein
LIFVISCFFLKLPESDYVIGTKVLMFHFQEAMSQSIGQIGGIAHVDPMDVVNPNLSYTSIPTI